MQHELCASVVPRPITTLSSEDLQAAMAIAPQNFPDAPTPLYRDVRTSVLRRLVAVLQSKLRIWSVRFESLARLRAGLCQTSRARKGRASNEYGNLRRTCVRVKDNKATIQLE